MRSADPSYRAAIALFLLALATALDSTSSRATAVGETRGEGAFVHLRVLQDIALASGGNRAAGTPGYDRSADYVADRLRQAGYQVRFEEFTFPFFEERSPPVLLTGAPEAGQTPAPASAVRTLANSGSGDVTGRLRPVNLGLAEGRPPETSTSGCEPADFEGFERGAVALVRRGTCPFQRKVENSTAAGASGVVVMNDGVDGRTDAFSGMLTQQASIPVVAIPYEFGRSLASAARTERGVAVRLAVDAQAGTRATRNVLAEMPDGAPAQIITVGAHLDSVPEGPGINDNGSGSAAVLEAALRLARAPAQSSIQVRFAFWGAEERGLFGSRHHVNGLSQEREQVALYINLDMVGSPNFGRFVQAAQETTAGLAILAQGTLVSYFRNRNLPVEERASGRGRNFGSDDISFAEKGIPTLGLHTGAEESKADAQAVLFGGAAGRPYDPCYHRSCDTIENIDQQVLEEMTGALTHTIRVLAFDGNAAVPTVLPK